MIEIAPLDFWRYELDWDEARFYCFSLNINGKTGWRLPTVDELTYLMRDDSGVPYRFKWVWTTDLDDDGDPMQLDLGDFTPMGQEKAETYAVWVYPVRDLKDD